MAAKIVLTMLVLFSIGLGLSSIRAFIEGDYMERELRNDDDEEAE